MSIKDIFLSVIVFPPAFYINKAIGATSYRTLSLALCFFEAIQLKTPCPFNMI